MRIALKWRAVGFGSSHLELRDASISGGEWSEGDQELRESRVERVGRWGRNRQQEEDG